MMRQETKNNREGNVRHDWMPGMGWGVGPLFMIAFWVLVILGMVYVVKVLMTRGSEGAASQEKETALEILKTRYARGKINREKRKDLE